MQESRLQPFCHILIAPFVSYHENVKSFFSEPWPQSCIETTKRVMAVVFLPVAYPALGILALMGLILSLCTRPQNHHPEKLNSLKIKKYKQKTNEKNLLCHEVMRKIEKDMIFYKNIVSGVLFVQSSNKRGGRENIIVLTFEPQGSSDFLSLLAMKLSQSSNPYTTPRTTWDLVLKTKEGFFLVSKEQWLKKQINCSQIREVVQQLHQKYYPDSEIGVEYFDNEGNLVNK